MNIAISTLVTPPQKRGVGNYVAFLLKALQTIDQHNHYFILTGPDIQNLFEIHAPNFETIVLPFRHEPRLLMRAAYIAWQNSLSRRFLQKAHIDVMHVPNLVPILNPAIPTVVTIHDLAEFQVAKYSRVRQAYRKWVPRTIAKNAQRVIVVSESSKDDLYKFTGYPKDRIDVTYEASAIDPQYIVQERIVCKQRFGIDGEYLLNVGSTLPHKNHRTLIRAFEYVKKRRKTSLKLVLVGDREKKEALVASMGLDEVIRDDIIFTGYVPDDMLPTLYHYAAAYVFPSTYEGFGLTVLDAMRFGTPVITSNISSLPEVAGDAALLIDPLDTDELAQAIISILDDNSLRQHLSVRGRQQAATFSWESCARLTLRAYQQAIDSHNA